MTTTVKKHAEFLKEMREVLLKDADTCQKNLNNAYHAYNGVRSDANRSNMNFWCMTTIRVFFSAVEGILHSFKVVIEKCYDVGEIKFSEKELSIVKMAIWKWQTGK